VRARFLMVRFFMLTLSMAAFGLAAFVGQPIRAVFIVFGCVLGVAWLAGLLISNQLRWRELRNALAERDKQDNVER
jgi:hypothetical protein